MRRAFAALPLALLQGWVADGMVELREATGGTDGMRGQG